MNYCVYSIKNTQPIIDIRYDKCYSKHFNWLDVKGRNSSNKYYNCQQCKKNFDTWFDSNGY